MVFYIVMMHFVDGIAMYLLALWFYDPLMVEYVQSWEMAMSFSRDWHIKIHDFISVGISANNNA